MLLETSLLFTTLPTTRTCLSTLSPAAFQLSMEKPCCMDITLMLKVGLKSIIQAGTLPQRTNGTMQLNITRLMAEKFAKYSQVLATRIRAGFMMILAAA